MGKRRYTQTKRAARQAATRDRIVQATLALHEEVGPRATTVSAIAERAGVQRLTVYRHFPDETALFQACTTSWLELNPPPDPAAWSDLEYPLHRVRRALTAFYRYYRSGERMWSRAYRDRADVAALEAPMAAFEAYLGEVRDGLSAGWNLRGQDAASISAILGHGLRFSTWQSLQQEGVDDTAMANLVAQWVACIGGAEVASFP
jgi:AcrR family transcriptional regulator